MILIVFLTQLCPAQLKGAVGFKLTDTKSFFEQFTSKKERQERGEFETKKEYERRMSNQADTSSVLFFRLDKKPLYSHKNYKYDLDAEKLTFTSGECINYQYHDYELSAGTSVVIQTRSEDNGTYEASNAFGKSVTVEKTYFYDYVLNFINLSNVPDSVFDKSECTFNLSISKGPKEAEKLSKNLLLVIGVKLLGYQQSAHDCVVLLKPTIDSPSELAKFSYLIEVKLVKLILYDNVSKTILAQFQLPE